jgi:hypothetical protein
MIRAMPLAAPAFALRVGPCSTAPPLRASIRIADEMCLCGEQVAENGFYCADCWDVENGQFGVGA